MDFDADHKDTGLKEKATSGLVFMFQPLTDIYTQPVTVVASKGSIICTELAKLMIKCIILLERARANVHHIVSYQIKANRKMWSELEVSEKNDTSKNCSSPPLSIKRKTYIFWQVVSFQK